MRNAFLLITTILFTAILSFFILIGVVTFKSIKEIEQHGLKSVIETIWYGKEHVCQ
jgi:hypothetical protein